MSSPQEPWKKDMLRRFYHQPGENNISRPIGYKVEGQQKKGTIVWQETDCNGKPSLIFTVRDEHSKYILVDLTFAEDRSDGVVLDRDIYEKNYILQQIAARR